MKIDLTYLKNMSAGNKELVMEMIGIFKDQVAEFAVEMDQLLANKEYELLGRLAHKAKSSISIMGLTDLATELKSFEILAKAGEKTDTFPSFVEMFKKETNLAVTELDEVANNIDIYI